MAQLDGSTQVEISGSLVGLASIRRETLANSMTSGSSPLVSGPGREGAAQSKLKVVLPESTERWAFLPRKIGLEAGPGRLVGPTAVATSGFLGDPASIRLVTRAISMIYGNSIPPQESGLGWPAATRLAAMAFMAR